MDVFHQYFLIVPSAREDSIGRWMPVVSVRSAQTKRGSTWSWVPRTMVLERMKSRDEAEQRSVQIAKLMIDRGVFRVPARRCRRTHQKENGAPQLL